MILSPNQIKEEFRKINNRIDYMKETLIDSEVAEDSMEDTYDEVWSQLSEEHKLLALEHLGMNKI